MIGTFYSTILQINQTFDSVSAHAPGASVKSGYQNEPQIEKIQAKWEMIKQ